MAERGVEEVCERGGRAGGDVFDVGDGRGREVEGFEDVAEGVFGGAVAEGGGGGAGGRHPGFRFFALAGHLLHNGFELGELLLVRGEEGFGVGEV